MAKRISRKMSNETKQKIALANKGKIRSDETKFKISEGNKGKIKTTETRKKISKSLTQYWATIPE
jgi:predicted AAA+ superfamily ATPase